MRACKNFVGTIGGESVKLLVQLHHQPVQAVIVVGTNTDQLSDLVLVQQVRLGGERGRQSVESCPGHAGEVGLTIRER